ncbi:plasmid partitioning protein RepB [Pontivivens insulae]|uniref:Chromosome-partitioning protein ParB n=1 Tax=Pontivivens insulae TaxID=1639689 RepID=A0A2R8AFW9_9RHOB|nr:plasmid partitioning protein RepB [Pontivivens insulae]RED10667.1 ParB family chromosome partitioning protein [Pontivivens insulae]SPF31121.1 Chromosome-partitioning protein ParB [Pontivivens insulae]
MARKDLLKGLMDGGDDAPSPAPSSDAARPRYQKGAIGAVSRSIAELKSRSLTEIDADLIDPGGLEDRLDLNQEDHLALVESIREHGQQVPILVRPNPDGSGRFEIVYGRRRVAALRTLGRPVKAMVRDLDDRDLIIAQGQENTARRDLTFIEKANFARQMRDGGYDRKTICDALHLDKTVISRMLQVADAIPAEVIRAIGAAPGAGRPRWLKLAELLKGAQLSIEEAVDVAEGTGPQASSDDRFAALITALTKPRPAPASEAPQQIVTEDGTKVGALRRSRGRVSLDFEDARFADWLTRLLPEFHSTWRESEDRD